MGPGRVKVNRYGIMDQMKKFRERGMSMFSRMGRGIGGLSC
jgi:hypothetical protein